MGDNNLQFEIISSNKKIIVSQINFCSKGSQDLCQDLINILQKIQWLKQLRNYITIRHQANKSKS